MHAAQLNSTGSRALAAFVNTLRPDWDIPGIAAALHRARHRASADQLAIALIRLTRRDDLRTPAVLADDGAHWRGDQDSTGEPTRFARCDVPGHSSYPAWSCGACRSEQLGGDGTTPPPAIDPDRADAYARGARQARAAIDHAHTRHQEDQ